MSGKAYKALMDAKNRNGQRNAFEKESFGDHHQRYNARKLVAEFFDVTEYEIRKAIKLTRLIPQLQEILETTPKRLNLACADLMADYDPKSQEAFVEMCSCAVLKAIRSTNPRCSTLSASALLRRLTAGSLRSVAGGTGQSHRAHDGPAQENFL